MCNCILKSESSVSIITTLIDLLTIEARSFSSQTIKTIKIVEMSSGPVLLPSYHQPPLTQQTSNVPQSVVVISTNQQQQQQQQPTYAVENTEINKSYYGSNNKLIIHQYPKTMTVANVISSGNLLTVAAQPAQNTTLTTTPIIVSNTNVQLSQTLDKKRKHDCKYFILLVFNRVFTIKKDNGISYSFIELVLIISYFILLSFVILKKKF